MGRDQGVGNPLVSLFTGLNLGLCPFNERRRYFVTTSLIGWGQTENQPWFIILSELYSSIHGKHECNRKIATDRLKYLIDKEIDKPVK